MLEIRPNCENCGKSLPNESNEAMICSFECTFCENCVNTILENVCPNCGGGLEKRPSRPKKLLEKYPSSKEQVLKKIDFDKFSDLKKNYKDVLPNKR